MSSLRNYAAVGPLVFLISFLLGTAGRGHATETGYSDQYIQYVPYGAAVIYPMRQGLSDDPSDAVTPGDWYGQPICMHVGASFQVKLVDNQAQPNMWRIMSAKLSSAVTGAVYWQTGQTGWMQENTKWPVVPISLPNTVDHLKFEFQYVASASLPLNGPISLVGSNDIYVVLGNPKSYMSPAWRNILEWSCESAQGASSYASSRNMLTLNLYNEFEYDYSQPYYTLGYPNNVDGETFWAHAFLRAKKGQCNDFGDFLSLAMQVVGDDAPAPTRSYPIANSRVASLSGWTFKTNLFNPAGLQNGITETGFSYHQFVNCSGAFFDGAIACLILGVWSCPMGMGSIDYESVIADYFWSDLNIDGQMQVGELVDSPSSPPWSPTTVELTLSADDLEE